MDRHVVVVGPWTFAAPSAEDWFASTEAIGDAVDFGEQADAAATALGGSVMRLPATQVPEAP